MATVHVIGAGLSGLACALRAAGAGRKVALYEAAGHAGGRCRSFPDRGLGRMIDNGNHLLLGANHATRSYLAGIGAADAVAEIAPASFPFHDLASGERWRLRPGPGPVPLWLLVPGRRIPGTTIREWLALPRLARARAADTVADCTGSEGALFDRLWQPLSRAALNTDAGEASARLLWSVLRASLLRGEAASRPLFFHRGLSPALIDPALAKLAGLGVGLRTNARLRGLDREGGRVTGLRFAGASLPVAPNDAVVLAVPPEVCRGLWPELAAPVRSRAIVNAHFRLDRPADLPWGSPFLGLVNAETQWLFARGDLLSATVSAADRLVDRPAAELAALLWAEAAQALGRDAARRPPWRIVKERRATIAQTPAELGRRAGARTGLSNLFVAGDWTATGLPATIEGSIRSGARAAALALEAGNAAAGGHGLPEPEGSPPERPRRHSRFRFRGGEGAAMTAEDRLPRRLLHSEPGHGLDGRPPAGR